MGLLSRGNSDNDLYFVAMFECVTPQFATEIKDRYCVINSAELTQEQVVIFAYTVEDRFLWVKFHGDPIAAYWAFFQFAEAHAKKVAFVGLTDEREVYDYYNLRALEYVGPEMHESYSPALSKLITDFVRLEKLDRYTNEQRERIIKVCTLGRDYYCNGGTIAMEMRTYLRKDFSNTAERQLFWMRVMTNCYSYNGVDKVITNGSNTVARVLVHFLYLDQMFADAPMLDIKAGLRKLRDRFFPYYSIKIK